MRLLSTRVNGDSHRLWTGVRTTPEPWSFYIPPNQPVRDSDGREWSSPYPVVSLFWPGRFYQVFILLQEAQTAYYCNVIGPPEYDSTRKAVVFVDLDLDLYLDENCERVLDRQEFDERNADYPQEWVEAAVAAIAELQAFAVQRSGPFARATAQRWRVWALAQQA